MNILNSFLDCYFACHLTYYPCEASRHTFWFRWCNTYLTEVTSMLFLRCLLKIIESGREKNASSSLKSELRDVSSPTRITSRLEVTSLCTVLLMCSGKQHTVSWYSSRVVVLHRQAKNPACCGADKAFLRRAPMSAKRRKKPITCINLGRKYKG